MTKIVWSPSGVSVASMASSKGSAPCPFRQDSSDSRVVTRRCRGRSQASTRPLPSQPSDSITSRNVPPGRRSPSTSPYQAARPGIGQRRPQGFDVGVVPVLDAHDAFAVRRSKAAQDAGTGMWVARHLVFHPSRPKELDCRHSGPLIAPESPNCRHIGEMGRAGRWGAAGAGAGRQVGRCGFMERSPSWLGGWRRACRLRRELVSASSE